LGSCSVVDVNGKDTSMGGKYKPQHLRKPNKARGRPSPNRGKGPGLAWLKAHVNYEGEGCLIYPFSRNEKGYGQVGIDGKILKAHRVMCTLVNGEPPEPGYNAAHSCHQGHEGCVHPKHLDWKTPSENTQESAIFRRGTSMPRRLTIDQVEAIRASDKTHAELAAEYGMAVNTIGKIIRREIWVSPRSKLTLEDIRAIKARPEHEALALGKSLGLFRYKVLKIRAGEMFTGVK
jgi:hypothetical protein